MGKSRKSNDGSYLSEIIIATTGMLVKGAKSHLSPLRIITHVKVVTHSWEVLLLWR